jgi:hypothetical protein
MKNPGNTKEDTDDLETADERYPNGIFLWLVVRSSNKKLPKKKIDTTLVFEIHYKYAITDITDK